MGERTQPTATAGCHRVTAAKVKPKEYVTATRRGVAVSPACSFLGRGQHPSSVGVAQHQQTCDIATSNHEKRNSAVYDQVESALDVRREGKSLSASPGIQAKTLSLSSAYKNQKENVGKPRTRHRGREKFIARSREKNKNVNTKRATTRHGKHDAKSFPAFTPTLTRFVALLSAFVSVSRCPAWGMESESAAAWNGTNFDVPRSSGPPSGSVARRIGPSTNIRFIFCIFCVSLDMFGRVGGGGQSTRWDACFEDETDQVGCLLNWSSGEHQCRSCSAITAFYRWSRARDTHGSCV